MSKQNDGGPAFGQVVELRCVRVDMAGAETWEPALSESGMSLRDYFAAKAMQSIVIGGLVSARNYDETCVTKNAYKLADAMLKERER